ncbi:BNR-4 repeat-containing protein [Wenyingzhuangia sp. IMCC45574]
MIHNVCKYLVLVGLLLTGCHMHTKTVDSKKEEERVEYFSDNGFGNAVAVVQHPAGVYHKGVTYVCYQGALEDPYVASYNHKTKVWSGPFKAATSVLGKDPYRRKKIDNHGKPSIIIDDLGYIHLFFGGHGATRKYGVNKLGNYNGGENEHVVSKKPLDISSWEKLNTIPPFGTYNQLVKMDNGDLYIFYRHGAHRSNWVYQKSTDNGRTFAKPVSFLKHKRRTDKAAEDSWYPWITRGKGDELIVAFDYHLCSDLAKDKKSLGHIAERYNLYYMVMDTKTNLWKNVKGEVLPMPLTKEVADKKTLITRTDGHWTFQGITDLDEKGNPHVAITIGKYISGKRSKSKRMNHYKWNGLEWKASVNDGLPLGAGDIEVHKAANVSFYIAGTNVNGQGEVVRWDSFNGGDKFKRGKVYLTKAKSKFAISSLIENPHPDARLIVAQKEPGSDFRKMYLLGDNGPVKRLKSEVLLIKGKDIIPQKRKQ